MGVLAWLIVSPPATEMSSIPKHDSFFDGKTPASVAEAPLPPALASAPAPPPEAAAQVQMGAGGKPTLIVGPGAPSVLAAYCNRRDGDSQLEPIGIVMGVPRSSRYRMGLFRDLSRPDAPVRAIRIWRDPRSHTWLAGDGKDPILEEDPPSSKPAGPAAARAGGVAPTEGALSPAGAPSANQR